MRVRKKPWAEGELQKNPRVVKGPEEWKGRWAAYFGNDHPIYVEIGCGKGRFLTQNAVQNPEINYIGIERQMSVVAVAARRIADEMENVALIPGRVEDMAAYFAPGEMKRLYINFCDPWPKKKWAKRRLTYRSYLQAYQALFGKGGEVFFKTDNRGLFEFSLNEFCLEDWKLKNISLDLHNGEYPDNIMTEYEEKFSKEGMPIYRLEAYCR